MKKHCVLRVLLRILIVLIVVVAAAAILWGVAFLHRSSPAQIKRYETSNPHIFPESRLSAHRSGAGIVPEELLAGFKYCIDSDDFQVDYFEFDLHLTADDQLVLLHDAVLDRTSDAETVFGRSGMTAAECTLADLQRLNMGAKFVNEQGEMPYAGLSGDDVPDDLRIATLDQVLDLLTAGGNYNFVIEIKDGDERGRRAADLLYADLKSRGLLERAVISSFNAKTLGYVRTAYPDAITGAGIGDVVDFFFAAILNRADYVPPFQVIQLPFEKDPRHCYYLNFGTAMIINYAHAHNVSVQYWTVNDEDDMAYLISLGADAITTDYPDRFQRVMNAAK